MGLWKESCEASSGGTPCGQSSLTTITNLGISEVFISQKVFKSAGPEVRIEETREHSTRAEAMMLVVGQPPAFLLALQRQRVALVWALDRWISSLQRPQLSFERPYCCPCSSRRLLMTSNTLGTWRARIPAMFLSNSSATRPSSVSLPRFTMIWMDGISRRE